MYHGKKKNMRIMHVIHVCVCLFVSWSLKASPYWPSVYPSALSLPVPSCCMNA
jgi:hypothetical protein